tara:strand:+ start:1019 stop:1828 length:810 start_codon:yes stop_codon:yes gene_type:complete
MNNKTYKCIVAVPARLESKRLPKKVLMDIGGKSMIHRVLEQCSKAKSIEKVILCTDSEKLKMAANELGYKVFLTKKDCESGTDRIASKTIDIVSYLWETHSSEELCFQEKVERTIIINVQGDQPFINPVLIDETFKILKNKKDSSQVVTPIYRLKPDNIHNPNIVKTLISNNGTVIYFSRSAIPHVRDVSADEWHLHARYWGHAGIYGFTAGMLLKWEEISNSNLEKVEKLEQLRLIDAGYKISTFVAEEECLSVDTEEQLSFARSIVK